MYTKGRNSAGADEKVTNWANWRLNEDELDKFYCISIKKCAFIKVVPGTSGHFGCGVAPNCPPCISQ